ncbi:aminotransferase class IV family protein [Jiangella alkaliphila]|uniref:Branched-chain amino acid aminotransferase/4-amino-4-deoxychorismate lyase n=1 Tax=Jiangella alkaliphila TaxID=419479 RepID=A0A1H2KV01_9ACTN|nr:aminotransferase class IV family protein [Jiangella alkaliphila]SDU72432.1 Branched-chain amino acid aminotransferase/4-amino-4-deoxychorismate lyase [Jiangella alkaliphila]
MIVHRNGRTATADDLAPLAFAGYAHFTAAQARDRRIRGLDLHLDRLRVASLELFGRALPDDEVRTHLRTALAAGPADVSLTATVYASGAEFRPADGGDLDLLVRTSPPATAPAGPLALAVVEYERYLAAVKHTGEVAKTHALRRATATGFDDAAFVDRHGRLTEASIWNLAFWDGTAVVWPVADVLGGITMGILRRQLAARGVPQRDAEVRPSDLPALAGAVVMNSWTPGVAVHRIGDVQVPAAPDFVALLHDAYAAEPLTAP